jgi:hypothetical protein
MITTINYPPAMRSTRSTARLDPKAGAPEPRRDCIGTELMTFREPSDSPG